MDPAGQISGTPQEPARRDAIGVWPIVEIIDRAVAQYGDRPCIDFLGRRYRYDQVARQIDRAALGFQALGVRKGTRVGLCLPNSPYSVICYYAILKAGGTVVNYNPLYVERELEQQIRDSGTRIMVTLDLRIIHDKIATMLGRDLLDHVVLCSMADALPWGKGLLFRLFKRADRAALPSDPRYRRFGQLIDNDGRPVPVTIDPKRDIAVLQYTGGTTGVPKGAMLTHANLAANAQQLALWVHGARPGEERMLCVLPFFHVFAMTCAMNLGLQLGAELVLLPRFELSSLLKAIAKKRVTLFPAVPTIYGAINNAVDHHHHDLSSLRFCVSGGAPLPLDIRKHFEQLTGCSLVEGYGLSEASPVVAINPLEGPVKDGSVGPALAGTEIVIRSLSDPTEVVAGGEKGEVCIRGPQVMAGYWQRPAEDAAIFYRDELRTGDVGYLDSDGYLFLVDRIKDVILCGGYNVYPRIIEEALYRHPAVAEAVVIGVPDPYRGEAPKAFVHLHEGELVSADALRAYLETQISKIELPREIVFRDSLPKTMVGKLSKKELVAEEQSGRKG